MFGEIGNLMKFKEGDRVVVYNCGLQHKGMISNVTNIHVSVITDTAAIISAVHYKQCRLLKSKKRKRLFANFDSFGNAHGGIFVDETKAIEYCRIFAPSDVDAKTFEFIEVKNKEKK